MGLAPSDVLAWSSLTGRVILPVEYELLCSMDAAYLSRMFEHREEQRAKYQVDQNKPKQPTGRKAQK